MRLIVVSEEFSHPLEADEVVECEGDDWQTHEDGQHRRDHLAFHTHLASHPCSVAAAVSILSSSEVQRGKREKGRGDVGGYIILRTEGNP